jgi:hypothetical protein
MATLITVDELRVQFAISPDIGDGRLSPGLTAAAQRLQVWVGSEAYADAWSDTPVDENRRGNLRAAEAHLAMHFALLGLNTVLRPGGVVRQEQVEGGVQVQYLNPAEMEALTAQYLSAAEELVRSYLIADQTLPAVTAL